MEKTKQRQMTNVEAVDVLMEYYPTSNYTMLREAVDLAVKKLKQGNTANADVKNPIDSENQVNETVWSLTTEEAVEVMMKNYPPNSFTKMREAIDLAVKALKQTN